MMFERSYSESVLWSVMGVFAVLLFFVGVAVFALMIRQKRAAGVGAALLTILLSYGLFQYIGAFLREMGYGAAAQTAGRFAAILPDWLILSVCVTLTIGEMLLFCSIVSHRKNRVTMMSIKEATDGMPMGVLCYVPNGRILLVNPTMERFGKMLTGELLADGANFAEKLHTGEFLQGCQVIDTPDTLVIRISDDSVWTVTEQVIPYEDISIQAIMVSDITDAYRKTQKLRQIQEKVLAQSAKLIKTNQEIVTLTAEQELLAAKVKIHDELGQNLLSIKRLILSGAGTEQEKAEIVKRLRKNIDFLKGEADAAPDEYELMIGTAKRLGVDVIVSGTLPQMEPLKHILAAGIHECFTNTLRHAHGNRLNVCIAEDENLLTAIFTNNGEMPTGEIQEKGGLKLLRSLTERAGGHMTVSAEPDLSITIELPKEV